MSLQKNAFSVGVFQRIMNFSAWLQELPSKVTPPPFRLLQIGSYFWQSRALYVATRLDIASILGNETRSVENLAAQVSAQPDALYRLLRMLAAMGVFTETTARHFKNNKLSDCLREDKPNNVRAMILMHNSPEMSRPWYEQLEQGVRSGETPFKLTHGDDLVSFMNQHSDFDALFARAMDSVEALSGDAFATDFAWERFQRVIDIGGSNGSKALAILKRHPNLRALVMDRPQVIEAATQAWERTTDASLRTRLEFVAGDMFESVPLAQSDQDIYLLSAVLHGFDDAACIKVLQNIATASRQRNAYIVVLEIVMETPHASLPSTTFDMQMFMGTPGRERTLADWQTLFSQSGLTLEEVVGLRSFGTLLVLRTTGSTR